MSTAYGFAGNLVAIPPLPAAFLPRAYDAALSGASQVSADTTGVQSLTVTGVTTADAVFVSKPSHQAGLGVVNVRVSAANTIEITYMNATGSGITPTSETYKVIAIRCAA